jgi:hypothetical protein
MAVPINSSSTSPHHLLPEDSALPGWKSMQGAIFITVEPDSVALAPLRLVDLLIATGETAGHTVERFVGAIGIPAPQAQSRLSDGEALCWNCREATPPIPIQPQQGNKLSPRDSRKYAEAELPEDRSFYFRGPDHKMNLRAQNLKLFVQLGGGIDGATWLYHLRSHDYSRWIRTALKDDSLTAEIVKIESEARDSADQSRIQIFSAIERRYTAST